MDSAWFASSLGRTFEPPKLPLVSACEFLENRLVHGTPVALPWFGRECGETNDNKP